MNAAFSNNDSSDVNHQDEAESIYFMNDNGELTILNDENQINSLIVESISPENNDDDVQLANLLISWELYEQLYEFLKEKKINVDGLKCMKERHIDQLFSEFQNFNTKILFEHKLGIWQNELGIFNLIPRPENKLTKQLSVESWVDTLSSSSPTSISSESDLLTEEIMENSSTKKQIVSSIEVPVDSQFNGSTDFILSESHHGEGDGKPDGCCHMCRMKMVYKRLPILTWLPKYSAADAIGDLIAGITVGMTVIPQGLAYSSVAGLPPEFGLYGSFMGCLVYVVLGSCKDSTIGSTAVASLLVGQSSEGVWQRAVLLTFLTGLIEIAMGVLHLGFLVDFVSGPVNSGFTSAVALIILTSQMKNLLNVKATGSTFVKMWASVLQNITKSHISDTCLGLSSITFLLTFRWIGGLRVGPKDRNLQTCKQKFINKCLWIMGISRNGVLVIASALIGWYLDRIGNQYFTLVGEIPQGVPRFALPPFSIPEVRGNDTNGEEIIIQQGETFSEMIGHIGSGLVVVPLIALLENISVCKAFATSKPIDATQELFAMGFSNIGNSFFQGYRANGGLARSAVNNASGVRTPMSNLYIGSIVILALTFLTPYFYYIPKATLAAVIIAAVIFMIQYNVIVPMWRSKKIDLIPGFGAFFACLILPLQIGIFVGIGLNMVFILYYSARPKVNLNTLETSSGQTFLMFTPDRCLIFPSVEFVRNVINKSGMKTNVPVVVDCTYVYGADFTAAKAVAMMVKDFDSRNQKIIFYNLKPSVSQVFEGLNNNLILCYSKSDLELELTKEKYVEAP